MGDSVVSSPIQQELVIEITKTMLDLRRTGAELKEILKQELIDGGVNLLFIRRSYWREIYDYLFRGIPFWSPRINFAKWLKENKPEIYQGSCQKAKKND